MEPIINKTENMENLFIMFTIISYKDKKCTKS